MGVSSSRPKYGRASFKRSGEKLIVNLGKAEFISRNNWAGGEGNKQKKKTKKKKEEEEEEEEKFRTDMDRRVNGGDTTPRRLCSVASKELIEENQEKKKEKGKDSLEEWIYVEATSLNEENAICVGNINLPAGVHRFVPLSLKAN